MQIKKLIRLIFKRDQFRYIGLIDQARLLESTGVSINYNELENVVSILQNSYND